MLKIADFYLFFSISRYSKNVEDHYFLLLRAVNENTSNSSMLNIAKLVPPPESVPILFDSAIHGIPFDSGQFRNSGDWFDPESVEVAGIEPNSGIEKNSWKSVRFHRDEIPGIGWN